MKSKSRVKYIDCIRALCMLWIVGCWHLINDYCNINIKTQFTTDITYGVLGTFVFISGYFIGKKEIHDLKDVQNFIKSRLLRIYPLFFISCTSLYLMYILFQSETIVSLKQYLSTIFGLCMIITPAPSTVWFIGMIIMFYALTIPINMMNTLKGKVYVSAGLYIVMILLCLLANSDSRMLIYFPIYGAGLIMSRMKFSNEVKYALFIPSCLAFFVLSILRIGGGNSTSNVVCDMLIAISFTVAILQIGKIMESVQWLQKVLISISYSSMCAFLFHRQFYGVIKKAIGYFSPVMAVILLVVLLVISYYVQLVYDKAVEHVGKNKN